MIRPINLFILLASLVVLLSGCNLVDFSREPMVVTVYFDETFNINSSETSFSESATLDLEQKYEEAGIDPAEVVRVDLSDIIVDVLENNTNSDVTVSGNLSFRIGPVSTFTLASFSEQNLNELLSHDLSPLSEDFPLTVNEDALLSLRLNLVNVPPPTIRFQFSGRSSAAPIDFSVRVRIHFQVSVEPS